MANFFRRLFCRHEYEQVGWFEDYDGSLSFSRRIYRCSRCGKEICVDGRLDNIGRRRRNDC